MVLAESLTAWLLLPVLLFLIASGLTLLLERVARFRVSDALLAPVGACLAIVIAYPLGRLAIGPALGALALVFAAAAGLFLARAELPARLVPKWPLAVAGAAYLLYLAPVLFSGEWTWAGYNFVNDTAVHMLLADWFANHGDAVPTGGPSTAHELIRVYLESGYPLGTHALLGDLEWLLVVPLPALYHPLVSVFAALAAAALWQLARLVGLGPIAAAAVALASVASNLTYQYALQGNLKEIVMIAILAIAAALAREALTHERPVGMAIALALCLVAAMFAFSTAALPYVGLLGLTALAGAFVQPGARVRPLLTRIVPVALAILAVGAIPILEELLDFTRSAEATFAEDAAVGALGHLLEPLPFGHAAGIWLEGDYRLDVQYSPQDWLTVAGIVIVFAFVVVGVVEAVRRRDIGVFLLLVPATIAWLVLSPRISPYGDAKLLALGAPAVLFAAGLGIAALGRLSRFAPVLPAVAIVAGVLWSDALAFREVRLAPIERMEAIEDLDRRYRDESELILFNEFEEFAPYFAIDTPLNLPTQPVTPLQVELRLKNQAYAGLHFDLDNQALDYIEQFPLIILRRAPDTSRPPVGYSREYVNEYYEVWRRTGPSTVLQHLPIGTVNRAAAQPFCGDVLRLALGARDEVLVAARHPALVQLETVAVPRSPDWVPHPSVAGTVISKTPGRAFATLPFPEGDYDVWVRGSFGRTVEVLVDEERIGEARGVQPPGQWHAVGSASVTRGAHRVDLVRGGGSLRPGAGHEGELGPVAFLRNEPRRLVTVDPDDAKKRLCGQEWDWIERVSR